MNYLSLEGKWLYKYKASKFPSHTGIVYLYSSQSLKVVEGPYVKSY